VEVPALAGCLTLNKADFIRAGSRGAIYLAHRKAIQEAVAAQLAAWGDAREDVVEEEARRRKTRPVERDLAAVLAEMTDDFPLVASLVERRAGGQKRLPIASEKGTVSLAAARARVELSPAEANEVPVETGLADENPPTASPAPPAAEAATPPATEPTDASRAAELAWPGGSARRKPARLGLSIQFESRPDDPELGRLVESTVWVNDAHPAYRRAAASRAEGYHIALTVALALSTLAVEPAESHRFVTAFLGHWGEAVDGTVHRKRRGRKAARTRRLR
jgi:hypothetical protein